MIDDSVNLKLDKCIACHANSSGNHPDPLQISPLPPEHWQMVYMDLCSPGEYPFVVTDAYS